eukprot:752322-Hanusia_phi.AAC.9
MMGRSAQDCCVHDMSVLGRLAAVMAAAALAMVPTSESFMTGSMLRSKVLPWEQSMHTACACSRKGRRLLPAVGQLQWGHASLRMAEGSAGEVRVAERDVIVIIPGFLMDCNDFEPMARHFREDGWPAAVVPMRWWEWIPCLGGRSARPVLERIDYTVRKALEWDRSEEFVLPPYSYTPVDLISDFLTNPGGMLKVGGSSSPDEFPPVEPRGKDFVGDTPALPSASKVILVAHSAAGWISRIFLSHRPYGGRAYRGSRLVRTLITLGTPHGDSDGVAFENVKWANRESAPQGVRCVAVGGTGTLGSSNDFTRNACESAMPARCRLCCLTMLADTFCGFPADKVVELDGDGVTPLQSSLSFEGSEKLVLEETTHAPSYPAAIAPELHRELKEGKRWYGSQGRVNAIIKALEPSEGEG